MAVGVARPERKRDDTLSKLLTIGGAAVGGAYGGFAGAGGGMALGGMAGGMIQGPEKEPTPFPEAGEDGALSRRLNEINESPRRQIHNSLKALEQVEDPNVRAELAKPLLKADYAAKYAERYKA